ncbi:MAG: hypothetical protein ACP5NF_00385 [Thermoanaerobaculum sp.]
MKRSLLLLAVALLSAAPLAAGVQCASYHSRIAYDPVYGMYCGYYGDGCTECWYIGDDGWGVCVTDGVRCEPRIHPLGP